MIVKGQKPICFDNKCDCIVALSKLEEAILWYQDKPTASKKRIYMHGKYPAISIHNEKIHVHRLIMSFQEGRRLHSNEHVHHINHNKLDSRISNLEIIGASEHLSSHNKGKRLTQSHRDKIKISNKNRKGIKMKKKVDIPLSQLQEQIRQGYSINKIARYFECDWSTIKSRLSENPELLD